MMSYNIKDIIGRNLLNESEKIIETTNKREDLIQIIPFESLFDNTVTIKLITWEEENPFDLFALEAVSSNDETITFKHPTTENYLHIHRNRTVSGQLLEEYYGRTSTVTFQFKRDNPINELIIIYDKLYIERSFSSIVAENQIHAYQYLTSYLTSSSNKYLPLITMYNNQLTQILSLSNLETREIDTSKTGSTKDESYIDSQLRKFNDTPQAGNNPNLITDNYLTQSERNTIDAGERNRTIQDKGMSTDQVTRDNNLERALALREIENNISDIYRNWMHDIDREILIYEST